MQRIVVLNPKGGSGKTTLAINLAAFFAARGEIRREVDRERCLTRAPFRVEYDDALHGGLSECAFNVKHSKD